MSVLLVVAEMQEAEHLIKHYNMKNQLFNSISLWANGPYSLVVTGPGVSNVITSLSVAAYLNILTPRTNVINIGYAGAKGLSVGQVVDIRACHCLDFPKKAQIGIKNCVKMSTKKAKYDCWTSFDFVEKADSFYEAVFDMELFYIARFVYGKLYSIKIISDNLDYNDFKEFDSDKAWKTVIRKIEEIREEED